MSHLPVNFMTSFVACTKPERDSDFSGPRQTANWTRLKRRCRSLSEIQAPTSALRPQAACGTFSKRARILPTTQSNLVYPTSRDFISAKVILPEKFQCPAAGPDLPLRESAVYIPSMARMGRFFLAAVVRVYATPFSRRISLQAICQVLQQRCLVPKPWNATFRRSMMRG